jgi:hypothetical protein
VLAKQATAAAACSYGKTSRPPVQCRGRSLLAETNVPSGRHNVYMPDVSIYAAGITAAAALMGTALPLLSTTIKDSRRAEQARREQGAQRRRLACMDLLRAAGQFRARVADYYGNQGDDMARRLAAIREQAAETSLCAASVALLPPGSLAEAANAIAAAADVLAAVAETNTQKALKAVSGSANFKEFDECVVSFRRRAEAEAKV